MRNPRTRIGTGLTAMTLLLTSGLMAAQVGAAHADTGRSARAAEPRPEAPVLGVVSTVLAGSQKLAGGGDKGESAEKDGKGKGKGKGKGEGKGKGKGKGEGKGKGKGKGEGKGKGKGGE